MLLDVLTWGAIWNSRSAAILAAGVGISRTAALIMAYKGSDSFCAAFGCSNRKRKTFILFPERKRKVV